MKMMTETDRLLKPKTRKDNMPTYCFKCENCDETSLYNMGYDQLESFDPTCRSCGHVMKRHYAGEGIGKPQFSGSGFHATDYEASEGNGR